MSLTLAHSPFYCNITLTVFKMTNRVEQKLRTQRKGKSPWWRLDRFLGKKTSPFPTVAPEGTFEDSSCGKCINFNSSGITLVISEPSQTIRSSGTCFKIPTAVRNLHFSLFKVFDWLLLTSFWSSGVLHAVGSNPIWLANPPLEKHCYGNSN